MRIVFIDQRRTTHSLFFFFGTQIYMDFATRATRTGITHLPEIIMLISINDVIFRQELLPIGCSLVITRQTFFRRALKNGSIQIGRIDFQDIYQVFPCPTDGFFLKIIAKTPVSEHFKHGMMVSIMTHFFQIVMFSTYAQTFL